jgi:hypothetical protein
LRWSSRIIDWRCKRYPRRFQPREPSAFIRYRKDITDADGAEILRLVSWRLLLGGCCGIIVSEGENARHGEQITRAFLTACFAIIVIGTGGYFVLDSMQKPSGVAFSTEAARIIPQWSWRSVFRKGGTGDSAGQTTMNAREAHGVWVEECGPRSIWQWIFVDFGTPEG